MLKDWRIVTLCALAVAAAIWIYWWAASEFILSHEICSDPKIHDDCESYNVLRYSAWAFAKAVDHYSALITAAATIAIGYFTYTLKKSTDRLWGAADEQLRHMQTEAGRERMDRRRELDILEGNATAARELANVAQAALSQLERPYIFVFGVRAIKQDAETQDFFVEYSVANYGKMPAIIEAPHIGFEISDRGEPPIPVLLFDGHSLLARRLCSPASNGKK